MSPTECGSRRELRPTGSVSSSHRALLVAPPEEPAVLATHRTRTEPTAQHFRSNHRRSPFAETARRNRPRKRTNVRVETNQRHHRHGHRGTKESRKAQRGAELAARIAPQAKGAMEAGEEAAKTALARRRAHSRMGVVHPLTHRRAPGRALAEIARQQCLPPVVHCQQVPTRSRQRRRGSRQERCNGRSPPDGDRRSCSRPCCFLRSL